MTTKKQADQLWSSLSSALVKAGDAIQKIIQTQAWEPLGYGSFTEAWADRMSGVPLAAELRPYIVYQMFSEGMDDDQVADAIGSGSGVGPASIANFRRERSNGVPPDLARGRTTHVNEHYRKPPRPPQFFHIQFDPDEYDGFKDLAKKHDLDLQGFTQDAIRGAFNALS
ncbi:hypothetical protein SEA_DRE3_50 [Gordonia phage Dre3]|uniref:Uncharacterized protein n=1 Tax=Gordonia phage Gibbous TaxID=2652405 RepID=A0A5J6T3X2_9CAUD|nr:hypothetical protein QLQ74_gp50 [Gordonia phage Gibbous]QFG05126.1 hypothetical protein SEA_GIBBOUS_50 [Gordonia phage Gibbous]QRI45979.1 hypothetical protein SEA_DRE3_50 [Gordonia phage Dre3]